ncbi:MAG: sulfotransferase [Candidatus Omnitrophica bacterium]|nr:sulfotransferase [Candidatus Omnitrophota bacterium]
MHEGPKIIFLVCAGRTGSSFLHTLLDSHPEVLMLPMELSFYRMWDRLGCDQVKDAEEMVRRWTEQSKLAKLADNVNYGIDGSTNAYTSCDFPIFRDRFLCLLRETSLSRRDVFYAIHRAYADATGGDLSRYQVIIEFSAIYIDIGRAVEDFREPRFIQVVRDHRATYASIKQHFLNTRRGLFNLRGKTLEQKLSLIRIFNNFIRTINKLRAGFAALPADHVLYVKQEDLHLNLEPTMREVAGWLQIAYEPCLLHSTLAGHPWQGNSAFGKAVAGATPEVTRRWMTTLSPQEIRVIEYVFGDDMERFGYAYSAARRPSRWQVTCGGLIPFRGELAILGRSARHIALDIMKWPLRLGAYLMSRFYLLRIIADGKRFVNG